MHKYLILLNIFFLSSSAYAASGEAVYRAKCSSCHDSGAGYAPRLSAPEEWRAREARGRAAIYESAINGMPATAMAAKGGYQELTDDEVRATVDYMLARVGFRDNATKPVVLATLPARDTTTVPVDDATLVTRVAEALQKALAPGARIDPYAGETTVRGLNVRVAARDGVVTLTGAVENSNVIPRVQAIARDVAGVRGVESRLVAAGMLDFD